MVGGKTMEALRHNFTSRALVATLILGMALPVGFAGTAGAAEEECNEGARIGYISLAYEDSDTHALSQLLYLSVFQQPQLSNNPHRDKVNGIDTYVFDLHCTVPTNWAFCLDDEPWKSSDGLSLFADPIVAPEYEIAFYENAEDELKQYNKGDSLDTPEGSTSRAICQDIPENSRYAVVYLDEGTVNAVKTKSPPSVNTAKFRFTMLRV